ncbi:hypothetical protein [Streptomyces sp. NPDC056661]|uniref:hypothetical protein n=1 Tax=Streptomyces sp. NPDC056661 TaxID=3345898 RepID=UPI00367F9CAB
MGFLIEASEGEHEKAMFVARRAQLLDIRPFELHAKMLDVEAAADMQEVDEFGTTLSVRVNGDKLICDFQYDFTLIGLRDQPAVELSVHLAALFRLRLVDATENGIEQDFLDAFARTTGQLAVHPYLRSAVSELTARLGISPVTLDLLMLGDKDEQL